MQPFPSSPGAGNDDEDKNDRVPVRMSAHLPVKDLAAAIPPHLAVLLRMVVENNLVMVHLAMQALLHACHPLLLADWRGLSTRAHLSDAALSALDTPMPPPYFATFNSAATPSRPRLPPASARASCPAAPEADTDGFCTDGRRPDFGQRMDAVLVHAVGTGSPSSLHNLHPQAFLASNFPGQVSIWTSWPSRTIVPAAAAGAGPGAGPGAANSNNNASSTASGTGGPGSGAATDFLPGSHVSTAPRPAGLASVGPDVITIRYVDVDSAVAAAMSMDKGADLLTPTVSRNRGDDDGSDDDATTVAGSAHGSNDSDEDDDQEEETPHTLEPLAEFARAVRRTVTASPLSAAPARALADFVGSIVYCIHLPVDRISRVSLLRSPGSAVAPPQDLLVFEMAAPPVFSTHAVCALSKAHAPRSADDWTPNGAASRARRWFVAAEPGELDSLLAMIPARAPVPNPVLSPPAPVGAWWAWADVVTLANKWARLANGTTGPTMRCERCRLLPPTSSGQPPPSPPLVAAPNSLPYAPRARTASGSTCDRCGTDILDGASIMSVYSWDTTDDDDDDASAPAMDLAATLTDLQARMRQQSVSSTLRMLRPGGAGTDGSAATQDGDDDIDESDNDLAPPPVTLHALPPPNIVAQVLEDTRLPYHLLRDADGHAILAGQPALPLADGSVAMSMSQVMAELKIDLAMDADVRVREQLEHNLIARRQILNVLYLYGLLPDHPDSHPPTDLLHASSHTFPRRNHLLGTLKSIFTSCFTDFLNFEATPATLGEVLNRIPSHSLVRQATQLPATTPSSSASSINGGMATDQAPQRRPALFRAGSRRRSSTSTSKPVSRGQNAADTAAATLSVPPTPTTVASSLSAQRGSTRRRSSWLSVISEASTSAPTVLDSVPATPTVANGVFSGPPKRSAPKSSVPLVFYSLCLGTDASPEQHWHCSLCRKCSPVDSHHCPSCNQCVYVPGSSSLPQFRPAASAIAAAEREAELDDLQCESATVSPYTPHLTTPARTVRIADEVTESREASESTARTSPNRRRALASLRTGLRSSVHFSPCPTCAVSVPTGIPSDHPAADMLRAPEGYVAAVPWVTDAWVDWMAERASPDDMDAVIADAQAVLPRLVYDGGLGGARAYEDGTSSSDPHGRAHGWTLEEVVWGSSSGESDSDSDDGDADDGSRTVEFAPRAVMMGTPPPTTPSRPATPSMSPAGPIFALPLNAQALPSLLHHPSPLLPPPPPIPTTAATMPSSPVPRGVSSTISNATGSLVSSASSSSLSDQRSVISAAREWEPLELAPGVIAYQTVAPTT